MAGRHLPGTDAERARGRRGVPATLSVLNSPGPQLSGYSRLSQGSGLGGTSLINADAGDCGRDQQVSSLPLWPRSMTRCGYGCRISPPAPAACWQATPHPALRAVWQKYRLSTRRRRANEHMPEPLEYRQRVTSQLYWVVNPHGGAAEALHRIAGILRHRLQCREPKTRST